MTSHQGTTGASEQATGIQDKNYNLVSVLYHALQGGETCMQYMRDAEHAGDEELVQFFQEVQECERHLAGRAREMLKQRLGQGNGEEWNREQTMGMHQHAAATSRGESQGAIGPQRQVRTTDGDEDTTRRSRR